MEARKQKRKNRTKKKNQAEKDEANGRSSTRRKRIRHCCTCTESRSGVNLTACSRLPQNLLFLLLHIRLVRCACSFRCYKKKKAKTTPLPAFFQFDLVALRLHLRLFLSFSLFSSMPDSFSSGLTSFFVGSPLADDAGERDRGVVFLYDAPA